MGENLGHSSQDETHIVNYITSQSTINTFLLFSCALAFSTLAVFSTALLITRIKSPHATRSDRPQKLYLSFFIIFSIVRSIFFWFLCISCMNHTLDEVSDVVWFSLWSWGSDFFFSTFIILLYYWAKMYHCSKGGESISGVLVLILNSMLYLFQLSEYLLYFDEKTGPRFVEQFRNVFNACFSLSLGLGMLMYSWKLHKMFGAAKSPALVHGARWLSGIAGLCMICFISLIFLIIFLDFFSSFPSIFHVFS
eukprot:TRINITY_DN2872_c0_g1_i3.p1 TRINITY_DN2872_c0_g1~~TRINITY_DN2872_c0_g1_i3.p1  ORF type:complete len:264 (+),score=34.83 TRINITY_DN2872_c0_g1_i3:41-793(+)